METTTLTRQQSAALWEQVCADPYLRDLPYKVETNELGQIVLSPHKTRHSDLQGEIILLLARHAPQAGRPRPAYPVQTTKGVKVCDVIWISSERAARVPEGAEASPIMPELCIEVLSGSNTTAEIDQKRRLYLDGGAEEVWIVSEAGKVTFYDASGETAASGLAPSFPNQVQL